MAAFDFEVMKEVPGYKAILKAVIKSQIQQLVEQLVIYTEEESLFLTASVVDGTLSHLGSKSGKGFLDDNEIIKSQFLCFCLKNHQNRQPHKGYQDDKEKQVLNSQVLFQAPGQLSPKAMSPSKGGYSPLTPVRSSHQVRHEPYPVHMKRNTGRRSLNVEHSTSPVEMDFIFGHVESQSHKVANTSTGCDDTLEIKIECVDDFEETIDTREHSQIKAVELQNQEENEDKSRSQNVSTHHGTREQEAENINSERLPLIDQSGISIPDITRTPTKEGNADQNEPETYTETSVKVVAVSESEFEKELAEFQSPGTSAEFNTDDSRDANIEVKVSASGSEGEGSGQMSRMGQILTMDLGCPGKLSKYQHKESLKSRESKRFASHDVSVKLADAAEGDGTASDLSSLMFAEKPIGKSRGRSKRTAADIFRLFLVERGVDVNFEFMPVKELATLLSDFYINARTKEGNLYKLNTLTHIRYSLNGHLKLPPCSRKIDILHDEEFAGANRAFKKALLDIRASGKGDVSHHPVISEPDLILLYGSNCLSPRTPSGLQNRVMMNIRLTFSREHTENMAKMTKDAFRFATNPDGSVYVYRHVNYETSMSSDSLDDRSIQMEEDRDQPYLCPVRAFKIYLSKLHPSCDRLWQYPRDDFTENDSIWYRKKPVGKNVLAKFMSNLSKAVPLSKIYTNQSIRLTANSIHNEKRSSLKEVLTLAAVNEESE